MTDLEKNETEKVASQLADAIHNFNKLNNNSQAIWNIYSLNYSPLALFYYKNTE